MKEAIEELFSMENEKYDEICRLDISGVRFIEVFSRYLDEKVSNILKEKDTNIQGGLVLDFLENVKEQMISSIRAINQDRENLRHKVMGIKESYHYIDSYKNRKIEQEKIEKKSIEDKQELIDEIKSKISQGIDPEKEKREIGTRPEQIKNIRKAKSEMSGSISTRPEKIKNTKKAKSEVSGSKKSS